MLITPYHREPIHTPRVAGQGGEEDGCNPAGRAEGQDEAAAGHTSSNHGVGRDVVAPQRVPLDDCQPILALVCPTCPRVASALDGFQLEVQTLLDLWCDFAVPLFRTDVRDVAFLLNYCLL